MLRFSSEVGTIAIRTGEEYRELFLQYIEEKNKFAVPSDIDSYAKNYYDDPTVLCIANDFFNHVGFCEVRYYLECEYQVYDFDQIFELKEYNFENFDEVLFE